MVELVGVLCVSTWYAHLQPIFPCFLARAALAALKPTAQRGEPNQAAGGRSAAKAIPLGKYPVNCSAAELQFVNKRSTPMSKCTLDISLLMKKITTVL